MGEEPINCVVLRKWFPGAILAVVMALAVMFIGQIRAIAGKSVKDRPQDQHTSMPSITMTALGLAK